MRIVPMLVAAVLIGMLAMADEPTGDPSQNACDCFPDNEAVSWECEGWTVNANIHVLQVGKCESLLCPAQPCKWEFDMTAACMGCGTVTLYIEGEPRASAQDEFVLLARTATKPCGEGAETWAIGTPEGACVEVLMYCDPCGI